jgi:hypothetical protein
MGGKVIKDLDAKVLLHFPDSVQKHKLFNPFSRFLLYVIYTLTEQYKLSEAENSISV